METLRSFILSSIPKSIMTSLMSMTFSLPPQTARNLLAGIMAPKPEHEEWIKVVEKPSWKGTWIGPNIKDCDDKDELTKRVQEADIIIFEVHGGGFRFGSSTMFMDIFIKWIKMFKEKHNMNALILSVEYSLAPEKSYPVPVLETIDAYKHLVSELNVPPSKVVFSGDSAGGAICFESLIRIYAPEMIENLDAPRTNFQLDIPAGLFLVSPLIISNTLDWSWDECKGDLVTHSLITCVLKEYLTLPDRNPTELHILRFAHLKSGFERFCPQNILVYYGNREVMRVGIEGITNAMKETTSLNVVTRREELKHDWYLLRQLVESGNELIIESADHEFVDFAANAVRDAST